MKSRFLYLIILILLFSCNSSFDRDKWINDNDISKMKLQNPRSKMVKDLIRNHLKKEMSKQDVIRVLGKIKSNTLPDTLTYLVGPTISDYKFLHISFKKNKLDSVWITEN